MQTFQEVGMSGWKENTHKKNATFQRSRHSTSWGWKIQSQPPSKSRLSGDHIATNKGMFGHHLNSKLPKNLGTARYAVQMGDIN